MATQLKLVVKISRVGRQFVGRLTTSGEVTVGSLGALLVSGIDGTHPRARRSLHLLQIAKGPDSSVRLKRLRFTYGVTADGKTFEFHDDWTKPERAHMVLDEPWTGYIIFTERGEEYMATQKRRLGEAPSVARDSTSRWADV